MTSDQHNHVDQLADEYLERRRRGENVDVSQYCSKYPEVADELRELIGTLELLEDLPATTNPNESPIEGVAPNLDEIAGYRIIGEIGRGGMGVVYEAEHLALRRRVAVKILPNQPSHSGSARLRFEREARAAAGMHHTNIVPVFEVGQENDYFFYAMQLIRGESLDKLIDELRQVNSGTRADRLQAGKSDSTSTDAKSIASASDRMVGSLDGSTGGSNRFYRSVARIGIQVAEALDYAHGRGIIHRDVKPSNLIQDESGVVWLTDFGLAKTDDEGITQTGEYLGTLRYMSPERFQGECDERSDIYALGLTLYELLLQRPAYDASDRLMLIHTINEANPPSPRSVNPRVPRDLETIVLKCIDKDVGARYASAKALAEDLRRFVSDQPIKARRHSIAERFVRWSRRNRSLAASLVTIGALLLLGVIGLSISLSNEARLRGRAETAQQVAEQRGTQLEKTARQLEQTGEELQQSLYFAQMNLAGRTVSEGNAGNAPASQLAKWIPVEGGRDLRGWEWYYLRALGKQTVFSSPSLYKDGFRWCWCVDYSPDGGELVNTVNGWGIQIRDGSGNVLREKLLGSARFVDWSPDGTKIAVSGFGEPGRVQICDPKTLEVILEIECPDHHEVECVRWSPNSSRIAVCGDGRFAEQHTARIHDAETGEVTRRLAHDGRVTSVDWSPDGTRVATAANDRYVRTWNVATGEMLAEFYSDVRELPISWSPDGTKLAGARGSVRCWDVVSGEELQPADASEVENIRARSVTWHPSEDQMAVGCTDGSVRLFDGSTLQISRRVQGQGSDVWAVAYRPDGQRLASVELTQGVVRVWDIGRRNQNQTLHPSVDPDRAVVFEWTSDGNSLIGTRDIWELATGEHQAAPNNEGIDRAFDFPVFAVSSDSRRVAFGAVAPRVYTRDVSGDQAVPLPGSVDRITCIGWSVDGKLATLSNVGDVAVWNADGKRTIDKKLLHEGSGYDLRWSPDACRVATVGTDNYVRVWDATEWELVWETPFSLARFFRVCWSPDGEQLAVAGDSELRILDAATGKHVATLDEIQGPFDEMDWSPDGKRLAVCGRDSLSIWDVGVRQVAFRLIPGGDWARWSPDGRKLAVGRITSGKIRVLDATLGYD